MPSDGPGPAEVTQILRQHRDGDADALDRLVPLVYDELRRLAAHYMKGERRGHTLQPTALVHEAYARLLGSQADWKDRAEFFRAAACAMRRVLVDNARAHRSAKRGGGIVPVTFDDLRISDENDRTDVEMLDQALDRLAAHSPRKCQVVELHFLVGLSYVEIAKVLGVSEATVDRDMRFARAWLKSELAGGPTDG